MADDVDAESARANVLEIARADSIGLDLLRLILNHDLESDGQAAPAGRLALDGPEAEPDEPVGSVGVAVADHIGEGFIDGEGDLTRGEFVEADAAGDSGDELASTCEIPGLGKQAQLNMRLAAARGLAIAAGWIVG